MCVQVKANLLWQLYDWLRPPKNILAPGNKNKKEKFFSNIRSSWLVKAEKQATIKGRREGVRGQVTITDQLPHSNPPLSSFPLLFTPFLLPLTPLVPLLSSFLLPFSPRILPFLAPFFASFQSTEERRVICGIVVALPTVILNLSSTLVDPNSGISSYVVGSFISCPEQSPLMRFKLVSQKIILVSLFKKLDKDDR